MLGGLTLVELILEGLTPVGLTPVGLTPVGGRHSRKVVCLRELTGLGDGSFRRQYQVGFTGSALNRVNFTIPLRSPTPTLPRILCRVTIRMVVSQSKEVFGLPAPTILAQTLT